MKLPHDQQVVLQQWKDATIKVLFKKEDMTECDNSWAISLVATPVK